jgi:hypothetical protein
MEPREILEPLAAGLMIVVMGSLIVMTLLASMPGVVNSISTVAYVGAALLIIYLVFRVVQRT